MKATILNETWSVQKYISNMAPKDAAERMSEVYINIGKRLSRANNMAKQDPWMWLCKNSRNNQTYVGRCGKKMHARATLQYIHKGIAK